MTQHQNRSHFFLHAGPLLLVLFIDGMGLGLVIPIINGLIFDPNSTFLSAGLATPLMHNLIYGGSIGVFMLCWFFGAAILGDLSDHIGRKKSLIICLIGAFLSYAVSAIAINFHSLALLMAGRIVAGLTSGSQPIAQAAIIDLSQPQDKTRNLGYILLSLSLGFVFGPLLGGVLSDAHFFTWFNFATPFYFASIISFINIIILIACYKESFVKKHTSFAINPYQAIQLFISAFKHPTIRELSLIFFIFMIGWSSFYSFISLFLLKIYQFTPTNISYYMALMGVGFGIGNGYIVNFFAKLFPLKTNYIYGSVISALIALAIVAIHLEWLTWALIIPLACSVSVAYAAILTLFSNQVDANAQGWVMGISGSIMAFVFGISGFVVGFLATFSATLPIYITVFGLALSAIYACFFQDRSEINNNLINLH